MDPSERRRRFEEFKRSIREGADARREKWEAGQVSLRARFDRLVVTEVFWGNLPRKTS